MDGCLLGEWERKPQDQNKNLPVEKFLMTWKIKQCKGTSGRWTQDKNEQCFKYLYEQFRQQSSAK